MERDDERWQRKVNAEFAKIHRALASLTKGLKTIMATLDAITTAVTNEETVEASIIALVQGIAQQLKDLIAAGNVTPAQVQAVADQIDADTAALSAAVVANTPAA